MWAPIWKWKHPGNRSTGKINYNYVYLIYIDGRYAWVLFIWPRYGGDTACNCRLPLNYRRFIAIHCFFLFTKEERVTSTSCYTIYIVGTNACSGWLWRLGYSLWELIVSFLRDPGNQTRLSGLAVRKPTGQFW